MRVVLATLAITLALSSCRNGGTDDPQDNKCYRIHITANTVLAGGKVPITQYSRAYSRVPCPEDNGVLP